MNEWRIQTLCLERNNNNDDDDDDDETHITIQ